MKTSKLTNDKPLNNREIASFCSQTAMILNAGISPAEGMNLLLSDAKTAEGKRVYQAIYDVCSKGESFYEGVRCSGLFPEYVLHMIKLGEESGNLDDVMNSLSAYYNREEEISDSIRSAISYPFIMIGMMLVVIIVLITKVLPIFNQVFIQLGSEMTGFSASLLTLGRRLNQYSVVFLILLFLIFLVCLYFTKSAAGRSRFRRFMHNAPGFRKFYENVACGRFASGMALTLSSGLDTYRSLDLVKQLVEHREMEEKIDKCKQYLIDGLNFSESIQQAGIFSNFYARMIAVGFKTGSTDIVMTQIADNYDKETSRRLSNVISILEPTLVIILSLIVGLILLSVILPLMGIMSSIG